MISFTSRKINTFFDLGGLLRQQRLELGLSLSLVSHRILVAERYLQAIEDNDWQHLPGEIYTRNFLKRYAEELRLDPERVIKTYESKQNKIYEDSIVSLQKTLPLPAKNFILLPKILRNSLIVILGLMLSGYLFFQVNQIISPPTLEIYAPTNNLVTASTFVVVSGKTEAEAIVKINNSAVSLNRGKFEEMVDLQKGLNIIKITAQKKYSKSKVQFLKIMSQPEDITKN